MVVKLDVPFHVRTALINIRKLKHHIDLIVTVSDARSLQATDLSGELVGTKVLPLVSKIDLSDIESKQGFNFKDSRNRNVIVKLIKNALEVDKYKQQIYKPPLQVLIAGFPNTGKSTLINLLKGKKVAISENIPGKTKKISKFPIGDNIWVYDTPGIFVHTKVNNKSVEKLFLLNSIPAQPKDYSDLLEQAYIYLHKHYLKELNKALETETPDEYVQFLEYLAYKYNFKLFENRLDLDRAEQWFLNFLRGGKIRMNWDKE